MALDSFPFQLAMQPETVQPRFPESWIRKDLPVRAQDLRLSSENRASSAATCPARTVCFDIFSPPPGVSDVIAQTKLAAELREALRAVGEG